MKKVQTWQKDKVKCDCSNCSNILPGSSRQAAKMQVQMTAVYLQVRLILFENLVLFYVGNSAV